MTGDQRAEWKAAIAAGKRQQRAGRWRRKRGLAAVTGAGMVRIRCESESDRQRWGDMTDSQNADRVIAECRAAVTAMATAFVTRDQGALLYLSGQITAGPTLPASQFMVS